MVKTLLWAIFFTNVFGFSYLISSNTYTPWIFTIIAIISTYLIGKKLQKNEGENHD